ncbi:hypothetical protein V8F44DRAFT_635070 [Aspergillus fumigatus]
MAVFSLGPCPCILSSKLIDGDAGTVSELTSAYLRNVQTSNILENADSIFSVVDDLFQLPLETKQQYSTEIFTVSKILGWKDVFESFMIPKDELFDLDLDPNMSLTAREPLTSNRKPLKQFVGDIHEHGLFILSRLSRGCHRKYELSTTGLRLLSSHANIGHIAHTDPGSLATVFSNTGCLQVFMPGSEDWRYVAPKPGHAIVNTKFSLMYLMYPEYDTIFTTSDGKEWRSLDWQPASHSVQSQDSVLTGRHGFIGLADTPSKTKP